MRQKKRKPKVNANAMVYTNLEEYEDSCVKNAKLLNNFGAAMEISKGNS